MSRRLVRVTDLFVKGREVRLPDGSYLYVRALNSFERSEALSDAQAARSRFILALQEGGDELVKVRGRLAEVGREAFAAELAEVKAMLKASEIVESVEIDPEWAERLEVLRRTDLTAGGVDPKEVALIQKINEDFIAEVESRQQTETEFLTRTLESLTDGELVDEWREVWLEQRGSAVANDEYRLTELWYATQYCQAQIVDTSFDHSACNGHEDRLFPTRADVRSAPDELRALLIGALSDIEMRPLDPKDSPSPGNSSAS